LLSNSWKQELEITEDGVEGEVMVGLKRIKMTLPFDRIAQVNLVRGLLAADLEVVNKGGADNLVVRALDKEDAERAKALIERRMQEQSAAASLPLRPPVSVGDELRKLADLRDQGILTEAEFQVQKDRLLR
jgi:hypothetical protein